MHPDQQIFYQSRSSKIVSIIAIIIYFSAFFFIIYGVVGKHYGQTTEKIIEKTTLKEKSKKMEHVKGYVQDSKRLNK